MKKKFAVIGGGITGCVAALHAAKRGFQVTLFEKDKILGGILKDINQNNEIFFNSCQYFNPEEGWYKKYIENNFKFKVFKHEKGSYTDIFNKGVFARNVTNPTYDKEIDLNLIIKKKKLKKNTLRDRFNHYPKFIGENINKWVANHNFDTKKLSWNHPNGFACGRIFLDKKIEEVKILKKNSKLFDDILCLPDYERNILISFCSVPLKGFNFFFEKFQKLLIKNDINLNTSTVVRPLWKRNKLIIIDKGKNLVFDKIFWSGNPTGLIKSYGAPLLDSKHIACKNIFFNLSGNLKHSIYFQIFSKKIPITRLYFYKLDNKIKLTVETSSDKFNVENILNFCKNFINVANLNLKFINNNAKAEIYQKKYIVVSCKDEKIIKNFLHDTKNTNLIPGVWLNYARDNKINLVLSEIDKVIKK